MAVPDDRIGLSVGSQRRAALRNGHPQLPQSQRPHSQRHGPGEGPRSGNPRIRGGVPRLLLAAVKWHGIAIPLQYSGAALPHAGVVPPLASEHICGADSMMADAPLGSPNQAQLPLFNPYGFRLCHNVHAPCLPFSSTSKEVNMNIV
mmetsp:Transcript_26775/g.80350  ORF Transcript_26775/g.80350 Transcript_26775/m.80350 type:complete len:147 (+) Transcript_26775:883-1323(+)